jgi:hypothetical protein
MSSEWVGEGELSSEPIQIRAPSFPIHCKIQGDWVEVLYNPTVGANLMSHSFALAHLSQERRLPTVRTFRNGPRSNLTGLGLLHNITLHHEDVELALDFHIFDIEDFDILIGHPLEKLFLDPPQTGELDVKVGRDMFTFPITRAKNSISEPLPHLCMPVEEVSVLPFKSPEESLEKRL